MERVHKYTSLILYTISGFLLGVGFIFPALWISGLIGVAVFAYLLNKTENFLLALGGSFVAWTVKSSLAVFWLWHIYPIEWIEHDLGAFELPVIGFYWFIVSIFLGLGGAFFSFIWLGLRKYFSITSGLILFPVIWVGAEVFSSLSYSFLTLGQGVTPNTLFSFGYMGYLFGNHELFLLSAKIGGVYTLSFGAVFIGYLLFLVYKIFARRKALILITAIITMLVISSGVSSGSMSDLPTKGPKVAVIDTSFNGAFFLEPSHTDYKYKQISEAIDSALSLNPDYIILPEDSRYTNSDISSQMAYRYFRFQSSDSQTILIDSGRVSKIGEASFLRATIYDGTAKKAWVTDKRYVVPQGEFVPYFSQVMFKLMGMEKAVAKMQGTLDYQPGPSLNQNEFSEAVPAILFCFESVHPYAVKRLALGRKVPFVAHPISHAWFHESEILRHYLDVMLKIQALWSNVPIVSAGNMVKGALYTSNGIKISPTPVSSGDNWEVSLISW